MALPSGTVTFLFTDIEGSTRLLQRLGERYGDVQRTYRQLLRSAVEEHRGHEVDTQGDAFFFSFARARDAVSAAVAAQTTLREHPWPDDVELRVRMGLHTGEPVLGEEGYLGLDVVRAARLCEAGHGRQILISETTRALLGNELPDGTSIADLGEQNLKDIQHEHVFQVLYGDEQATFPPLRTPKKGEEPSFADSLRREIQENVRRSILEGIEGRPSRTVGRPVVAAVSGFFVLFLLAVTVLAVIVVARWVF